MTLILTGHARKHLAGEGLRGVAPIIECGRKTPQLLIRSSFEQALEGRSQPWMAECTGPA